MIEATSGNTGIALAMISGVFGLDIELGKREEPTKEEYKQRLKEFKLLQKKGVYNPEDWIGL